MDLWVKNKSYIVSGGSRGESISLPFLPSRNHLHSLFMALFFNLESHHFSLCFKVTHLFCHSNSPSYLYKDPCDCIGPTQITQDHLPISRSLDSYIFNVLFAMLGDTVTGSRDKDVDISESHYSVYHNRQSSLSRFENKILFQTTRKLD